MSKKNAKSFVIVEFFGYRRSLLVSFFIDSGRLRYIYYTCSIAYTQTTYSIVSHNTKL